ETESLIISLSSEEIVFLIYLIGVFQRVFFPHGKHLHIVYIQNTPQIRVPDELYTEEIVGLTLHPIRTIPQHGSGGNGRIPPCRNTLIRIRTILTKLCTWYTTANSFSKSG